MLLLLDECTPRAVELVFRERAHDVVYAVDNLAPQAEDQVIAAHAHQIGAVVVTWNAAHGRAAFRDAVFWMAHVVIRAEQTTRILAIPSHPFKGACLGCPLPSLRRYGCRFVPLGDALAANQSISAG